MRWPMQQPNTPRLSRRCFVRLGCLGAGSFGLSQSILNARSNLLAAELSARAQAKSCILLWLDGGPSHLETFDPKDHVPVEVRGPFESIPTKVAGIQLSELLPMTAQITDKLAILRSVTSPLGEHGIANHYMLTGYQPSPQLDYPSLGSVVAQQRPSDGSIPPYVIVPEIRKSMGSGFLGPDFLPFATVSDPAKADFQVRHLDFYPDLDSSRLERRKRMLEQYQSAAANSNSSERVETSFQAAFDLLESDRTRLAFRIQDEPDEVRQRYGSRSFGQGCLLARRLVEHGVRLVTVVQTGWDTHENLKLQLRDGFAGAKQGVGLVPTFDQAYSALIDELASRGLLDETLVVAMGEFGRTPKINIRGGRDHWPRVFSVVFAGGGVKGGQVIGSSDRTGESPKETPVTPADLAHAIYTQLGIDPAAQLPTLDGRSVRINLNGKPIPGLV